MFTSCRASAMLVCSLVLFLVARSARAEAALTPPEPIEMSELVYPDAALNAPRVVELVLLVTVRADGTVGDIDVETSGGAVFDDAAMRAMRNWRFRPATTDGVPTTVRIRVPVTFTPPAPLPRDEHQAHDHGDDEENVAESTHAHSHSQNAVNLDDATTLDAPEVVAHEHDDGAAKNPALIGETSVREKRIAPQRSASDFTMTRDVLNATPKQNANQMLATVPGIVVTMPEGEGVAGAITLRGFDAEHGQDVEISVGAIPVNQPSHIHGQGYADLGFVIPEVIASVRATEGVTDPRQGDFAVAGSLHLDLGVAERGLYSSLTYGSFNTMRAVAIWAPESEPDDTFGAVMVRRTDGFGDNRGAMQASGIGQLHFDVAAFHGVIHAALSAVRANNAGVLRRDDIAAGRVDFYDSYDDPSAQSQSAFSTRGQVALSLFHRSEDFGHSGLDLYATYTGFRARSNYTGYLERSRERPNLVGRGDLIEQENQDFALGGHLFHRLPRVVLTDWLHGQIEVGSEGQLHFIEQAQTLLMAPQNETWDRRVDAGIRMGDLGAYADLNFHITDYVHIRGGLRADALFFDVDDRLGNFTPTFQNQDHIVGFRRTALGVTFGPRGTLEIKPFRWLSLIGSYGNGYRSPQARQLEEGENAPFTTVTSVEGGMRVAPDDGRVLSATVTSFATWLSNDLAFDPGEGALTRTGPTSRRGVTGLLTVRPMPSSVISLSATYVHATLDAPPPATPEDPVPAYEVGQLLPYVPPLVVRADYNFAFDVVHVFGTAIRPQAGLGLTYMSPRPLPYGDFAEPVLVADASSSLRWGFFEFGLSAQNVLNRRYAANEYNTVSDWGNDDIPSLIPERHIAAGPPLTILGTLTLRY